MGRAALKVIVLLVLGACTSDRPLNGTEIEGLFQGRTVEGYNERHEYHFQSFYEPNGTLRSYQGPLRKLREGRWWIAADLVCLRWRNGTSDLCRPIVERGQKYLKLLGQEKRQVIVTFVKFTDGNPHGL